MLDSLAQQFLGGGAESMAGPELHGNVGQMAQGAPNDAVMGAVGDAIRMLGPHGFGQSVGEAAQAAGPQQRQGLMGTLLQAVTQGGGQPNNALSAAGLGGGGSPEAGGLAQLAMHVAENHPQALASVIGGQMNSGGGSGSELMSLLGNPMARQIGMSLAKRML